MCQHTLPLLVPSPTGRARSVASSSGNEDDSVCIVLALGFDRGYGVSRKTVSACSWGTTRLALLRHKHFCQVTVCNSAAISH